MQINSINTNLAAYAAQRNIGIASNATAASVSRLSSGNRITQASDDVAALSIGTSLKTGVSTLRTALLNTSQGSSLLQVADGALAQVSEILQRQKAIAVQAGSGTLGSTERAFLDAEFQALTQEVDRISGATNFNGVKLIDGALSTASAIVSKANAATAGSLTLTFGDTIVDGETVIINGVTITAEDTPANTADKEFAVGSTLSETVQNLADRLNLLATDNSLVNATYTAANKLALSQAKYTAVGNALVITSRSGGALSNDFAIGSGGTATTDYSTNLGGSYGGASFNLFATTTGWTSASTVVSVSGGAAGTPLSSNGNTITATVDGVTNTLMTLSASGGTGTGSEYTLQDIVNGINSSKDTTGFRATLVSNGSTYNIRLDYSGRSSTVMMNMGANYNSTTYGLAGEVIDTSETSGVAGGLVVSTTASQADQRRSIFASGYLDVLNTNSVTQSLTGTAVTAAATAPSASTAPFQIGESLTATINGKVMVLHTFVAADGMDDIVASINTKTKDTGVYAAVVGSVTAPTLNIRLYVTDPSGGTLGVSAGASNFLTINATTTATAPTSALTKTNHYGLAGGTNDGVGLGNTTVSGSVGDSILTALNQTHANLRANFTQNASAAESIVIGGTTFYFTSTATASAAPNEILIGDTLRETLDNLVSSVNHYAANYATGSSAYELNQIDVKRDGDSITFTSKKLENVYIISSTSTASSVTVSGVSGASINNSGNLNNAATAFGVRVDGITNSDFTGKLQGFKATYKSTDVADLSIKVGDYTYTASNVDLTSGSAATVRLFSDTVAGKSGGYFDIRIAANEIQTFSTEAGANAVASRLNSAFSSLTFNQKRNVSSYAGTQGFSVSGTPTGSLFNSSVSAQLSNFDSLTISDITVEAPQGNAADAKISLTIGGKVFTTSAGLTKQLGAHQTYRISNPSDPENEFIDFTTGDRAIEIDSDAKASAFETALKEAFGLTKDGEGAAALNFQVGTKSSDSLSISIGSATTDELFSGLKLNVLTAEDAGIAVDALDGAIEVITSIRATVGALQSRFNFAAANIESAIQNQDAARGTLLDTDIAVESTAYATAQVKLQAGISVLAQANQQTQALLKLIG